MLTHADIYGLIGEAKRRGYKCKDIAKKLDITPQTFSAKMNGSLLELSVAQLVILAALAGRGVGFTEVNAA